MAIHWETVEEGTDCGPPIVSPASPSHENDSHVMPPQGPDFEHEAFDDLDCEFPDEDFDLEVDENEEQNTAAKDQEEDGSAEKEQCERGGKNELENELRGDGESRSRNAGTGRKGKSKKSGPAQGPCDQTPSWTASVSHRSFLASSGPSRHKQVKRRNQHLHNHSRARRKNGNQLVMVCRDFLAEIVSPWCISCIHMVVELIISLTHRCGVVVESSGIALYDFGSRMLCKVTDIPGLTQDLRRILDWSRFSAVALIEGIGRTLCWARHALLSGFRFVCATLSVGSQMMRCVVGRLAGERGRKWWLAFQSSRVCRKVSDLTARIHGCFFKQGAANESSNPESPNRGAEKWQPGEELQRLLALAKVVI